MNRALLWARLLLPLAPVASVVALLMFVVVIVASDEQTTQPPSGGCSSTGGTVLAGSTTIPGTVAGYSGEQLTNAALIVNAGAALGLSVHGQTIGVMTAMGESSLRVIDYGDGAGPDSRGLFQQRANGAWGSYSDRMDPTISATNFFRALMAVPGWETLTPTEAAHRTQRNADPNHYTRFWNAATQVMQAVAGVDPATLPASGGQACAPASPGGSVVTNPGAWVLPAVGRFTSGFGMRWGKAHNGVDIAAPCYTTPIYAAAAGTVVRAGPSTGYGNLIVIDHGGLINTRYAHMYPADVLVTVGQTVAAGEHIANIGTFGDSTGCHLHFEVMQFGAFLDPVPFLAQHGITLT